MPLSLLLQTLLEIFAVLWLVIRHPNLCLHLHVVLSLGACLSKFPLFIRTSITLDLGSA